MGFSFFWSSAHFCTLFAHRRESRVFPCIVCILCIVAELVGARPLHLAYARPFGRLKSPLGTSLFRCARKRELSLDALGKGQAILPCIFQQELAELLLRNRRFQIILAPLGVGAVEIGGAFLGVGLEADIRRCLHELGQVVAVRHGCFKVLDGALADGELIAVRQQTVQP